MEEGSVESVSGDRWVDPFPAFDLNGVLPPRQGLPYRGTLPDVVRRFTTSSERIKISESIMDHRTELRLVGVAEGFQWIGGGYAEDDDPRTMRPMTRTEVVTFYRAPGDADDDVAFAGLLAERRDLVGVVRAADKVEIARHLVALRSSRLNPTRFARLVAYWSSVLSHRPDGVWRGYVEVPLVGEDVHDAPAKTALESATTLVTLEMAGP